jgi:hypothetical protein
MSEVAAELGIFNQQLTFLTNKLEENNYIEKNCTTKKKPPLGEDIDHAAGRGGDRKASGVDAAFDCPQFAQLAADEAENLHAAS